MTSEIISHLPDLVASLSPLVLAMVIKLTGQEGSINYLFFPATPKEKADLESIANSHGLALTNNLAQANGPRQKLFTNNQEIGEYIYAQIMASYPGSTVYREVVSLNSRLFTHRT